MARRYYTLIARVKEDNSPWAAQFGDFDRETVEDEKAEYEDGGEYSALKIISTAPEQAAIDSKIAALNEKLNLPVKEAAPITDQDVVDQVFVAIEDLKYLEVGKAVELEHLSEQDNGIFPSRKSWIAFLNGNFRRFGDLELGGECKPSTIKNHCYDLSKYRDLFVARVGSNKFVKVDADDLEFSFTYDCNLYDRGGDMSYPSAVEIYVTANFK